jgi:hypothetical protein
LSDSLIGLSLLGKHLAPNEGSHKQPIRKTLLSTEGNRRLGVLRSHRPFSAEPMNKSRIEQGEGQAEGVSDPVREGEGLITPLRGLIRVTKMPERYCRVGQAEFAGVLAVNERMGTVSLGIVERDTPVPVFPGDHLFSKPEGCSAELSVRLEEKRRITRTLGQVEELLG